MPAVTRKGDADVTHCTGMVRSGASSNVFVNGIGVSRQGDNNTTHLLPPNVPPCPAHAAGIASGSSCSRRCRRWPAGCPHGRRR